MSTDRIRNRLAGSALWDKGIQAQRFKSSGVSDPSQRRVEKVRRDDREQGSGGRRQDQQQEKVPEEFHMQTPINIQQMSPEALALRQMSLGMVDFENSHDLLALPTALVLNVLIDRQVITQQGHLLNIPSLSDLQNMMTEGFGDSAEVRDTAETVFKLLSSPRYRRDQSGIAGFVDETRFKQVFGFFADAVRGALTKLRSINQQGAILSVPSVMMLADEWGGDETAKQFAKNVCDFLMSCRGNFS